MKGNIKGIIYAFVLVILFSCIMVELSLRFLMGGSFFGRIFDNTATQELPGKTQEKHIKSEIARLNKMLARDVEKTDIDQYLDRQMLHFKNGDYEKALADFEKAFELGWIKEGGKGRFYPHLQMLSFLEEYIKIAPEKAFLYFFKSLDDLGNNKIELAVNDFFKAKELEPEKFNFIPAWSLYSYNPNVRGNSVPFYTKILKRIPDAYKAYYYRGRGHVHNGNYEAAIKDFSIYLKHCPEDYEAYVDRATTCFEAGDYEKAASDFVKAFQIKPVIDSDDQNSWCFLNSILRLEPLSDIFSFWPYEDKDLISLFNNVIRLDSKNYQAYYLLGMRYFKLGKYEDAMKNLSKSIEIAPDFDSAFLGRGRLNEQMGNFKEAISDYSECLKEKEMNYIDYHDSKYNPEEIILEQPYNKLSSIFIKHFRARSYLRIKKYEETIADCQELIKFGKRELFEPRVPASHNTTENQQIAELINKVYILQGRAFEALGKSELALDSYQGCLRMQKYLPEDVSKFARERITELEKGEK